MNNNDALPKVLFTVTEVAKIFQVDIGVVYQLIKSQQLPALRLKHWKIRKSDMLLFLKNNVGKDFRDPLHPIACNYEDIGTGNRGRKSKVCEQR